MWSAHAPWPSNTRHPEDADGAYAGGIKRYATEGAYARGSRSWALTSEIVTAVKPGTHEPWS